MAEIKVAAAELKGGKNMAGRLYPPILDYSMPAFAIENDDPTVRIYFALPVYNSWGEVGSVHMTVRYFSNNENALGLGYPAKIKVVAPLIDEERITRQDKYYIELTSDDLANGFQVGTIYKIQLRFSKLSVISSGTGPNASWFNLNYSNFSEWSTVALIKPITPPSYTILGLEDADKGVAVNYASVDSVFTIVYSQEDSTEPLKAWRTRLYDEDKVLLLADSGENIYSNYDYLSADSTQSIAFDSILPYQMTIGDHYILQLDLTTRNGYSVSTDFPFTCYPSSGTDFNGTISCYIVEEEAYAHIHVQSETTAITNNLVIRRSSSKSNFTIWEDIAVKAFTNESVNWDFNDFTIESGVWYRYGVQTRDVRGHRGALTVVTDIVMGEFEDAFLLEVGGRQLKLRYDFNISTANITVAETKTDTIGSKYPFVRRNGNMYYRTFQCTGLITGYMDQNAHLFTNETELYNGQEARYREVRAAADQFVHSYDYTYEREFREKVQEFLYDDKIKLFKSLQEGNILVKLMNITLTPKNELGRLLYTFSAQAIEIDEPTIINLNNYGLQEIGEYATSINFTESQIGQVSSFIRFDEKSGEPLYSVYPANRNILDTIAKQFGWVYSSDGSFVRKESINNILVNDFQLNHLRIEFESEPYLIERNGSRLTPFTGTDTSNKDLILGWLLSIDNEIILVQPPNHIYELKEDNLTISSTSRIYPLKDTQMSLSFAIQLDEELNSVLIPISTTSYKIVGQLYRVFKPNNATENVIGLLNTKYARVSADGTEVYNFDALFTADIEAEPGTIFYARSSVVSDETKFVINETGNLFLDPGISGVNIASLHFEGRQIDIRYLDPLYHWDEDYHYEGAAAVQYFNNKHNNGSTMPVSARDYDFYTNNDGIHMFFNRAWWDCEQINDYIYEIHCPVTAIVNYTVQTKKGVYQRS